VEVISGPTARVTDLFSRGVFGIENGGVEL